MERDVEDDAGTSIEEANNEDKEDEEEGDKSKKTVITVASKSYPTKSKNKNSSHCIVPLSDSLDNTQDDNRLTNKHLSGITDLQELDDDRSTPLDIPVPLKNYDNALACDQNETSSDNIEREEEGAKNLAVEK